MFVVAITELGSPLDAEAQSLAADLGATPYEARILLATGQPSVVLQTPDKELATRLMGRIAARGHGVVGCDDAFVTDSSQMVTLKRFRLTPEGFRTEEAPQELLPYQDVLAIIRATHRTSMSSHTVTTERSFSAGRALLTGGLVMTTTKKREEKQSTEERANVVYLFRRSGERPWIMRQDEAKYAGLGADMQPTNVLNFTRAVAKMKELAPAAAFDLRLVSAKRIPERNAAFGVSQAGVVTASFTYGVDLLAHLLAMHFRMKDTASPYRK